VADEGSRVLDAMRSVDLDGSGGYLKIFLGYASGVGKSFRMLDEARRRRERGQDVVIGAVQPHTPPMVEALLKGLEVVPLKRIGQGTAVDVEALIRRCPEACFIDGLAYDNPPGSRNATRWQDTEELVRAGMKVIASVNIQYIAELREQVEAITGKHVTETVPVGFIKSADEIEIVDTPTQRPAESSPGAREEAERKQQTFLRLREMTLVLAADVVDHQLTKYLESRGIRTHFGAQERILVCLTPYTDAPAMVETAQNIAKRFHGELFVVHVRQPEMSPANRAALEQNLAVARDAGAQVQILDGQEPADTLLAFARSRGITQIFIGHSRRSPLWSRVWGNRMGKLLLQSRGMDVRIFPSRK
jgi:two-component system sensor histidine kinase KdpD